MKGEINEESPEYKALSQLINNAIRVTGSFKVTDFLYFILKYHQNSQANKDSTEFSEMLLQSDNREFCTIASHTYYTLGEMLVDDTKMLRRVMHPIAKFLRLLKIRKPLKTVRQRVQIVDEVDQKWESYSTELERCHAA